MLYLSNTQRNDLFTHILSSKFSHHQIKFLLYLYNTTYCVHRLSIAIPSIKALCESMGHEQSNFHKAIKRLIGWKVVIKHEPNIYSININYGEWKVLVKGDTLKLRQIMNTMIHKQLNGKRLAFVPREQIELV